MGQQHKQQVQAQREFFSDVYAGYREGQVREVPELPPLPPGHPLREEEEDEEDTIGQIRQIMREQNDENEQMVQQRMQIMAGLERGEDMQLLADKLPQGPLYPVGCERGGVLPRRKKKLIEGNASQFR